MNIMQYRALKAQESAPAPTQPVVVTPTTPTQEPPKVETKPIEPEKVTIEGVGDITFDELKNGYLRQADYTKKTQEVAKQRKEVEQAVTLYESLKANPQAIQQLKQTTNIPPALDPATAKIMELESKVYDMMLEKEIDVLSKKYTDFELREVLEVAQEKGITNLEDAYLLAKSKKPAVQPVNTTDLEKQIRERLLKEIEAEKGATQTIITSNGSTTPVQDNEPKISPAEQKVARMMRLSDTDYIKWRDAGRKK